MEARARARRHKESQGESIMSTKIEMTDNEHLEQQIAILKELAKKKLAMAQTMEYNCKIVPQYNSISPA
jgi:hypothetical protein